MAESVSSEQAPLLAEETEPADLVSTAPLIADLLRIPGRYLRSVHLERDFNDASSLQNYIVTPPMVSVFSRIVEGLRPGSGRRAWRITGDYGTGKSSFALVLAHLLRDPGAPSLTGIRQSVDREVELDALSLIPSRMVPVLVTGAREPLVPAIAQAIARSLDQVNGQCSDSESSEDLRNRAAAVAASGDASQLLRLLDRLGSHATHKGRSGVLLVLDELGKFLEYATLRPDREDVYVLQRIAEAAARSGECPLVVLGLLHQGFHAYAERLPSTARFEWDKVAGRYEEITFDQPLSHVTALVAGALNVNRALIPDDVTKASEDVLASTLKTRWYGGASNGTQARLSPLELYPLHPTVLPVLVRFFARFGQHERSLFSFLLSSEPFGLQSFAERPASGSAWYRLPDFYDYVRSVFGHRLAGASYQSHWLRISGTLDRAAEVDHLELRVLKVVAILNVLDAEHLLATDVVLRSSIADGDPEDAVGRAIATLKRRGFLFDRGAAGGYCLWPSTSVNLESAFEVAQRRLGPLDRVSTQIAPYLDASPVVARRHYIKTGTLRHFEVRYAELATLGEIVARPTNGDGLVVVALCETQGECQSAVENAASSEFANRPDVLLAIPPPLSGLAAEVWDCRCWQWVADNTPELAQDSYAAAEVTRQLAASRRALMQEVHAVLAFDGKKADVEWWRTGKRFPVPAPGTLSASLSMISDELYDQAPYLCNELLNRRSLSSAAAAARMRLIERMFLSADQPELGISPAKAPPEKSMYLSVLREGKVHREEAGRFIISEPHEGDDPLHLRPALAHIMSLLEQADGHRVSVSMTLQALQDRPYGIRAGVTPLLLAIVIAAHTHEIAVFEDGTFLHRFGPSDFLRLIKQPATFEIQLCRVVGVRAEVFVELARVFSDDPTPERGLQLLDVVRPLSTFAAQLPEYTRRSSTLSETAGRVRDALMVAREPATLIFSELPLACGLGPFPTNEPADAGRVKGFVDALRDAFADLRAAYPQLLERIRDHVMGGLAGTGVRPDRPRIAHRASRVVLVAREPRLQTFARCLADVALSEDAWAERVGSFVISKPPARWTGLDETRATDEIDLLAAAFCRVEATAFVGTDDEPNVAAVRLAITQADGTEGAVVVRTRAEDEPLVDALVARLEGVLADGGELHLAALARVVKTHLMRNGQSH